MRNNHFKRVGFNLPVSKIVLFVFLLFVGFQNNVYAQNSVISVSGTVKGEPLIGASVRIKNTSKGVITNYDGKFSIKVSSKKTVLLIKYAGMNPKEITVGDKKVFNIVLEENSNMLKEVVVTAMGLERKVESLTYATQKIKNEDLMIAQDPNFINSLQGKAAGLSITPNAGGAGGSSKILLRGNKSILGNNQPLIVIDGIPMSNPVQSPIGDGQSIGYAFVTEGSDALSSINPEDIESVNVLKGANAAALYGSQASNGVLMITTKKGKEGKLDIKVSSNVTFETPLLLPKFQNTYGSSVNLATNTISDNSWGPKMSTYTDAELSLTGGEGQNIRLRRKGKNDARDFFETGSTFNNSISFSGGTKKIKTYFSYGNTRSNGMIQNNTFMRHSLALRQSYSLFKDILNVDVSLNYVNQKTKNRPGGGTNQNPIYHLYTTTRSADMDYYKENYMKEGTWMSHNDLSYLKLNPDDTYSLITNQRAKLKGTMQNWLFMSPDKNNPYWLINRINRTHKLERVYGYISANVKITDDLKARLRYSIDRGHSEKISKVSATTQAPTRIMGFGVYGQGLNNSNEFYLDGLLSYNKEISDFSISANLGTTAHKITGYGQWLRQKATRYDFNKLILPTEINLFSSGVVGWAAQRSRSKSINWDQSLFFTGQLGYKNYFFMEGSYRIDRYRPFVQFHQTRNTPESYGYFSLGGNVLVHNFVKLPKYITNFKVRTSYSEVGNSIPNIIYNRAFSDGLTGAVIPSGYAHFDNPIPEKMKSFEAGFDMSFFRNSLNWDMTFYNTTMNNNYLLIGVAGNKKPVNSGVIRNIGLETNVSYGMNITKNLFWRSGINFSFNDNKIVKTYIDPKTGKESLIAQQIGWGGKFQMKYTKGGRYGDLYATDFERNADGTIALRKSDGSPNLSSKKFDKFIGNMNAKYRLGWNNTVNYKNFRLNFLIDGKLGGKVVSFTEAYLDRYGVSARTAEARLAAENDPTLRYTLYELDNNGEYKLDPVTGEKIVREIVPAVRMEDGNLAPIQTYYQTIGKNINATQYVYDATNFRLRELSFGYVFKDLLGKKKHLSLSVIARNLFFIYIDAPIDPDTSLSTGNGLGGFDIFNMPTARSIGVSASVSF